MIGRDILPNANADNDPAFADLIQGRQLLGQDDWISQHG